MRQVGLQCLSSPFFLVPFSPDLPRLGGRSCLCPSSRGLPAAGIPLIAGWQLHGEHCALIPFEAPGTPLLNEGSPPVTLRTSGYGPRGAGPLLKGHCTKSPFEKQSLCPRSSLRLGDGSPFLHQGNPHVSLCMICVSMWITRVCELPATGVRLKRWAIIGYTFNPFRQLKMQVHVGIHIEHDGCIQYLP